MHFPNIQTSDELEICNFLREKKLIDPSILCDNKKKIEDNPLHLPSPSHSPSPSPSHSPSPSPIMPRDWIAPSPRIVREKGIENSGMTCYMNALLQAINGTDYLYIQLLTDIHNSRLLMPITRYFDDSLRALRQDPKLLNLENTFCKQVWKLKDYKGENQFPFKGQEDSIFLFNVIVDKIRSGLFENGVLSPIIHGIVQPLKELNGIVKEQTVSLQDFIDAQVAYNIDEKNKDKKKLFDEHKMYMQKLLDATEDQRMYFTNDPENSFFAIDAIKQLAIENNIEKLKQLQSQNYTELNKPFRYGENTEEKYKLNQTRKSIKNALIAIDTNQVALLSNNEVNLFYIPRDILDMTNSEILIEINKPFENVTFQNLLPDETLLHTKDYKPFIILENHNKIKTTNNCNITIENQQFKLKSVIIKSGDAVNGHYFTITPEGEFNDDRFTPSSTQFSKFCINGDNNATFYFFENVVPPSPPIALGGGSIKNKYFHKYLKYKNKYLELSKLKQKKLGRK
jgi:hypothetical protein